MDMVSGAGNSSDARALSEVDIYPKTDGTLQLNQTCRHGQLVGNLAYTKVVKSYVYFVTFKRLAWYYGKLLATPPHPYSSTFLGGLAGKVRAFVCNLNGLLQKVQKTSGSEFSTLGAAPKWPRIEALMSLRSESPQQLVAHCGGTTGIWTCWARQALLF